MDISNQLKQLKITLDQASGHLFYDNDFLPIESNAEIIIVRHGETYGNCGQITETGEIHQDLVKLGQKDKMKRIYQGNVDKPINQLTQTGKQQARDAAIKLENLLLPQYWLPDVILHSPLKRAQETGLPFVIRNGLTQRYQPHPAITEMAFGAWENRRICDLNAEHPCHSLYLNQNALVKEEGIDVHQTFKPAECFAEVLVRAAQFIRETSIKFSDQKILLFSHSMFGAACCILFAHGRQVENGSYLAFDGKKSNGEDYTLPFATPIMLNCLVTI